MEQSIKVQPTQTAILNATPNVSGPSKKSCLMQVAHVHRLRDSEENYDNHQFEMSMQIMRNREGLGAPLRTCMDLFAARQVGRLPFLQSGNMMVDVLLGRDEMSGFSDFLGAPENSEFMNQPHVVMEKRIAIL